MSTTAINTIAIIGGTGTAGSHILKHLLASPANFSITLITRPDSKVPHEQDGSLKILRGDYTSSDFLAGALKGIDCLILALAFMAMDAQPGIITAAVEAGVRWILPTEYSADGANQALMDAVPLYQPKREALRLVTRLVSEKQAHLPEAERTRYIAVVTNPWVPFCLQAGMFSINPYAKTATLYSDAGRFNVSTLEQVGRGVASLVSLSGQVLQERYANDFVYISSASTTQREMFDAAIKVTGTTENEWEVKMSTCEERIRAADEAMARGDFMAGADGIAGRYMGEGGGGDYEVKAARDREVLGLKEESVEGFVRAAVELGEIKMG